MYSDKNTIMPKFRVLLGKVIGYGGLALAVIIPLGWWLGRKLVEPLNTLRGSMQTLPRYASGIDSRLAAISEGTDEIRSEEHTSELQSH